MDSSPLPPNPSEPCGVPLPFGNGQGGTGGNAVTRFVAVVLGLLLVGLGAPSSAQIVSGSASTKAETTPAQVGYGMGSVLGTLVYAPVKATFCILGALTSVAVLPFGTDRAERVVGASCRGTWVISPDVVSGQEPVNFVGDTSRP